jgi:hypothetical protein
MEKNEIGGACSAYGGEESFIRGFGGGHLRERDTLEDTGVGGRIILRWIFRKLDVADTCECGNEPLGSLKCGEFHD